jgi:hypothetical protein
VNRTFCYHIIRTRSPIRVDAQVLRHPKRMAGSFVRNILLMSLGCCAIGIILFSSLPPSVWGQAPETIQAAPTPSSEEINPQYENNVKAAFLYSFGRYVEWPKNAFASQSGDFIIGVCGDGSISPVLELIAKTKTVQGRRITILKMPTIDKLQPCQILFISHVVPLEQQFAVIDKLKNNATLLVGETPGFCERGGGINFYLENGTVRFQINVEAIRREKLMLDAKLLNLGKKISETAAPAAK